MSEVNIPPKAKWGAAPPPTGVPLTKPAIAPSLTDILGNFKRDLLISLFCSMPGTVLSYDPSKRTAVVQPSFIKLMGDGKTTIQYPPLLDCPVVTLQGGGGFIDFPVKKGDECLIFFSDRDIDAWYANGGENVPPSGRLHDLNDGFVLVGINSMRNAAIVDGTTDEVTLRYGGAKVGLKGGKVKVAGASGSLKTILDTMLTSMAGATTVSQIATAAGLAKTALDAMLY